MVLKVALDHKDPQDCKEHRAIPDTLGRQESKGQEEMAIRVILVQREI